MIITYAANNKNGLNVLKELKAQGVEIEYLILHPKEKSKYLNEIITEANVRPENIIFWKKEENEQIIEKLNKKRSEILFSVNFGYKIPREILEKYQKSLNLHLSYLPYNKGSHPNVWAIIEETPIGVTIHEMSEKIDKGKIIYQEEVKIDSTDTGKSLYEKLEEKAVDIIRREFKNIIENRYLPKENKNGTIHYVKDFSDICRIDLNKEYKAKHLLNILRALTYPPFNNAYFLDENGDKVYIEVKLTKEGNNENNI